jgi:hypothetical protein
MPDSVVSMGNNIFNNCSVLNQIVIPNSVTSIDTFAFTGCHALTSINIPPLLNNISGNTFANMSNLASLSVDASNVNYGIDASGVLFNANKTIIVFCPIKNPIG